MYMVDICPEDHNYVFGGGGGLSSNLFCTMLNIPSVLVTVYRVHGCECVIYSQLIVIFLYIGTKYFCDRFRLALPHLSGTRRPAGSSRLS